MIFGEYPAVWKLKKKIIFKTVAVIENLKSLLCFPRHRGSLKVAPKCKFGRAATKKRSLRVGLEVPHYGMEWKAPRERRVAVSLEEIKSVINKGNFFPWSC